MNHLELLDRFELWVSANVSASRGWFGMLSRPTRCGGGWLVGRVVRWSVCGAQDKVEVVVNFPPNDDSALE